jgi:class 3 adenylate cyclase
VSAGGLRYEPAPADDREEKALVCVAGGPPGRFPFHRRLEIGRDDPERRLEPGLLLLPDPTVSRHHCVVTQRPNGHCLVRDVSRNGTRLDGRRLVPNVETEWNVGSVITVGSRAFALIGSAPARAESSSAGVATVPHADRAIATVLVGDIHDYTVLVRKALSEELQRAVRGLFERLTAAVAAAGGTVKEFQGDAILAFWEGDASGRQAIAACRAALALDGLALEIAADRACWPFPDLPLRMDWALATGLVLIDSFGGGQPNALSMMGEPVVRAFRIEKHATAETGRIVTCRATREVADGAFAFRDLGEQSAKGFEGSDRVFALLGERG